MRLGDDAPQVQRAFGGVDRDHVADSPPERVLVRLCLLLGRVEDLAAAEVVVLGGIPVAPDLLALSLIIDRAERFEEADRVVLVDQVLGRQVHQPVELPPRGLTLATMPAEELSEQPCRLLCRSPVEGIGRHDVGAGHPLDEGLDPRLGLGQVGWHRREAEGRPGHLAPGRGRELRPQAFEPVAELQIAHDVVLVVALDPLEVHRRGAVAFASSSHCSNATMLDPASRRSISRVNP